MIPRNKPIKTPSRTVGLIFLTHLVLHRRGCDGRREGRYEFWNRQNHFRVISYLLFPASRAPPSKATESQCASQLSGLLHICPSLPTPEVSHVLRIKYLSPLEFLLQILCVCGCLGSMYVCGSQKRVLDPCNMDASCHAVAGDWIQFFCKSSQCPSLRNLLSSPLHYNSDK